MYNARAFRAAPFHNFVGPNIRSLKQNTTTAREHDLAGKSTAYRGANRAVMRARAFARQINSVGASGKLRHCGDYK